MSWSYYIYYRVDAAHAAACATAVQKLLATVRERTGIHGRFLKKRHEPLLWMEIYERVEDDAKFEWELAEAAAAAGIAPLLQAGSVRHVECFAEQ